NGSQQCPNDTFQPSTFVCRPAAGQCDAIETCPGTGPACPTDLKSTALCRPSADLCDAPEFCNGSANDCPPDLVRASGFTCRTAAGAFDVAEACDGTRAPPRPPHACRATRAVSPARAGAGAWGDNSPAPAAPCPPAGSAPNPPVCRAAAGVCDVADTCPGTSSACPADAKSTAVCRPAV